MKTFNITWHDGQVENYSIRQLVDLFDGWYSYRQIRLATKHAPNGCSYDTFVNYLFG